MSSVPIKTRRRQNLRMATAYELNHPFTSPMLTGLYGRKERTKETYTGFTVNNLLKEARDMGFWINGEEI